MQGQAAKLQELGSARLVDGRLIQDIRFSVDPRWNDACQEVLTLMVNASNPTRRQVIKRTDQSFSTAVPDGRVPSPAVAYRSFAAAGRPSPGPPAPRGATRPKFTPSSSSGGAVEDWKTTGGPNPVLDWVEVAGRQHPGWEFLLVDCRA